MDVFHIPAKPEPVVRRLDVTATEYELIRRALMLMASSSTIGPDSRGRLNAMANRLDQNRPGGGQ